MFANLKRRYYWINNIIRGEVQFSFSSPRRHTDTFALRLLKRGYAHSVWILKWSFAFATGVIYKNFVPMYAMWIYTHFQWLNSWIFTVFITLPRANHMLASVCMTGNVLETLGKHLASFPSRLLCQCAVKAALKQPVYTCWMHREQSIFRNFWNCKLRQAGLI